ncbi:MAG: CHASE2 domain-containing protein [Dysgonamonadaceae bacterium]|nr:CHASE2 domain-containing protein [Dysgonamonadaceae bacterium]
MNLNIHAIMSKYLTLHGTIKKYVNRKFLKVIFCVIHAAILTVAGYWIWNIDYLRGGEDEILKKLNTVREILNINTKYNHEPVVLINISYDKELVTVFDKFDIPTGKIDITDRLKIYNLLDILYRSNNYKYILCDIFLSRQYQSDSDSILEATINKMSRIRFPYNIRPEETLANTKSSYSGYSKTFLVNDFCKYEFISNKKSSLALDVWEEITFGKFVKNGLIYKQNGKIALNSVILSFPFTVTELYDDDGNKMIYNLGEDILNLMTEEEIINLCKDKIILIGSFFEQDVHSTIAGEMPGVLINYNAYLSLLHRNPSVPSLLFIVLFVAYFIMSLGIAFNKGLADLISFGFLKRNTRFAEFLCSWIGYGAIMTLLCIICYLLIGICPDILIMATWFTLADNILKIKNNKQNKTENK